MALVLLGLCWDSPHPTGRAYSAPPDPLAGFKGQEGNGGKRRGGEGRTRGKEKGRKRGS